MKSENEIQVQRRVRLSIFSLLELIQLPVEHLK
jgi:hypothetical protein